MRIINQNGTIDMPYDMCCVWRQEEVIYCRAIGSDDNVTMATYSSEDKAEKAVEMHTSYMTDESTFPFYDCKRVVYHPNTFEQLKHIHRTGNEIVRVVYVVTKDFTLEQIMNIAMFVDDSNEIDELSFRQLVDKGYEVTDYWQDILRFGHKKLWWYIEQCDYNLYYAENKIYTKFSEIGESNET